MLPAAYRLRASRDFAAATRRGKRIARPDLVLHFLPGDAPRVGFVVSKAVGGSVVRHRVSRKLRAATAAQLNALPTGSLVVRALPSADRRSVSDLSDQLDSALAGLR